MCLPAGQLHAETEDSTGDASGPAQHSAPDHGDDTCHSSADCAYAGPEEASGAWVLITLCCHFSDFLLVLCMPNHLVLFQATTMKPRMLIRLAPWRACQQNPVSSPSLTDLDSKLQQPALLLLFCGCTPSISRLLFTHGLLLKCANAGAFGFIITHGVGPTPESCPSRLS